MTDLTKSPLLMEIHEITQMVEWYDRFAAKTFGENTTLKEVKEWMKSITPLESMASIRFAEEK